MKSRHILFSTGEYNESDHIIGLSQNKVCPVVPKVQTKENMIVAIIALSLLCIGNDYLNLLTTGKRQHMRVDLQDFNNVTRYAEYDNFKVLSAGDKYKLSSLGTYSGTAGQCTTNINTLCINTSSHL